jgi:hypothetical protein
MGSALYTLSPLDHFLHLEIFASFVQPLNLELIEIFVFNENCVMYLYNKLLSTKICESLVLFCYELLSFKFVFWMDYKLYMDESMDCMDENID